MLAATLKGPPPSKTRGIVGGTGMPWGVLRPARCHQGCPEHPIPIIFPERQIFPDPKNLRNLRMPQSRRFGRPRSSRSQHSNLGGASCLSSTSLVQMLAAASTKVMDALFGFLARNDAECCKRELLGRSWRRDWGMRSFQEICTKSDPQKKSTKDLLGRHHPGELLQTLASEGL